MVETYLVDISAYQFKTWKRLKLRTYESRAVYLTIIKKAMCDADMYVEYLADDFLRNPAFTITERETDVDLVVVSSEEIGLGSQSSYREICTRALELGLELCPPEVGPALRLAYGDQPKRGELRIAMKAFEIDSRFNSATVPRIFALRHISGHVQSFEISELWLSAEYSPPEENWRSEGTRFVFVCTR